MGIILLPKFSAMFEEALPEMTLTPFTVIVDPLEFADGVSVTFLIEVELV